MCLFMSVKILILIHLPGDAILNNVTNIDCLIRFSNIHHNLPESINVIFNIFDNICSDKIQIITCRK